MGKGQIALWDETRLVLGESVGGRDSGVIKMRISSGLEKLCHGREGNSLFNWPPVNDHGNEISRDVTHE